MKNTKLLWYLLVFSLIFSACSKDDDDDDNTPKQVNESEVLVKYLESADSPYGADFANTQLPSIVTAEAVHTDVVAGTEMTIIDVRSEEDFNNGHIQGAINKPAGEVLAYVQSEGLAKDHKIVVACYTGQTAGWVTSILNIMGYKEAKSLLWGMSSWHTDCMVKWSSSVANTYATFFEDTEHEKGAAGALPALSTGKTTGMEILEARVAAVVAEGFGEAKITNATVFENTDNYYIVNYWGIDDYLGYGHIPGAMQYTPKESMKFEMDLSTLPTDKTIVIYCWTGQTSAALTTYLRVLGYDAKSLLFGANGMIYDELTGHKWVDTNCMGYEFGE